MLSDATVTATVAVSDISSGRDFYGNTLGLKQADDNPAGVAYQCGPAQLFIYESGTAGTGQATCASWKLEDVEGAVTELKDKGVTFEHYDMPGATLEGDVHVMGPMKSAWFKDPDGNILCIANM